jgi:dUTP pyrophosphatase
MRLDIEANACELIATGLSIYLKDPGFTHHLAAFWPGYYKHGVVLGNLVGLIDSDYQGS